MVSVPSVVGLTQQAATTAVARSKLRAVNRGAELSRLQQGRVTRTDPSAGARLNPGALVGYWLANGENVVPNLQDRTTDDAGALLNESGFRLGTVVSHGGGEQRVAEQDPAAGTPARLDSAVNVTVGSPSNGWTLWLIFGGLAVIALLGGLAINARMRLARTTAHALTIRPSLDPDGPVSFEGDVTMAGPATHLRTSLEDGEASFEEPGPVIERKEQNG
ncbi:MAG TPA: PASTA domain-containing protein [Candidatus Cybelea sp.]